MLKSNKIDPVVQNVVKVLKRKIEKRLKKVEISLKIVICSGKIHTKSDNETI